MTNASGLRPRARLRADILAVAGVGCLAIGLAYFWMEIGPSHPLYAAVVAVGTFSIGPLLGNPIERRIKPGWPHVCEAERAVHRAMGVGVFAWLLEHSGWNRAVADPMRNFNGTREDLPALVQHLRGNMSAHGACFLIHAALSVAALVSGHPWGAVWILLPGMVIHLYPVLLQRSIKLRIQPLLRRAEHRGYTDPQSRAL